MELVITGQALVITDGYAVGTPVLAQALHAFSSEHLSEDEEMRGLPFACVAAIGLYDHERWLALSSRYVRSRVTPEHCPCSRSRLGLAGRRSPTVAAGQRATAEARVRGGGGTPT